jgi:hypothetical protein
MTPAIAKAIYVLLAVSWYVIRYPYARRAGRTPVALSRRGRREIALLLISLTGLGILPFLYVATGFPKPADYPFQPVLAGLGLAAAGRSHDDEREQVRQASAKRCGHGRSPVK